MNTIRFLTSADGSIKAWTTMLYEVSRAIIGWSRKEKWYDGKVVSVSKLDIPVVSQGDGSEREIWKREKRGRGMGS